MSVSLITFLFQIIKHRVSFPMRARTATHAWELYDRYLFYMFSV